MKLRNQILVLFLFFISVLPKNSFAQNDNRIDQAIELIKVGCATGQKVSIKTKGNGGVSIFFKRGVSGGIDITKEEINGVVRGAKNAIDAKENENIRKCMQQYIPKILDAILNEQSTTTYKPNDNSHKSIQSKRFRNFKFDLMRCEKSASTVICDFKVTNQSRDRNLTLYCDKRWFNNGSYLIDNFNNHYIAKRIRFANCDYDYSCEVGLISGISTKASLMFQGVDKYSKFAPIVSLGGSIGDDFFDIQFRNVNF